MSEETEQVASSTTESTEAAVTEESTTSAETENTETTSTDHMIPKSRLDEVIAQRNEAREQIATLEAAKTTVEETKQIDTSNLPDPPAGLTERQIIAWYVKHDAIPAIEEELGMSLKNAKTLLGTTKETSQDYTERRWTKMCEDNGMDPTNESTQAMFLGLCKNKWSIEKSLKETAKVFGKKEANGKPKAPTATVETDGVTGVMTGTKIHARNKKHAHELAAKGVRADFQSLEEILEASKKEAAKR